ncbi:phage tail tip lysozyme [Megamonas hypermegale]|uniref:phage tail tip lysozyme n=1 Tax=Megamonas hypermegale TaxID=158847 RepID=UPI0026F008B1|nr:phage tail tip lysozyme [Megamonas hypermegale]
MANVIEEYLVSLGAAVNSAQFGEFNNVLNKAKGAINQVENSALDTSSALSKMVTGLGAVASAITAVGFATAKTIKSVADADMQYQILAKDIWTTKDNAKSLQMALDTMGAKLEDVAWIPELRDQFMRLRQEMQGLQTPSDANSQLKYIRSIGYEWQSFMLKIKMLKEWVAYYLIKYLAEPIERVRIGLKNINDALKMNMPSWGNRIARMLTIVVNLGINLMRFGKAAVNTIGRFFDMLPEGAVKIIKFASIIGLAFKANPMIAALSILILLIDDFYAYLDGRKSSRTFTPLWKKLTEEWGNIDGIFEKIQGYIEKIIALIKAELVPELLKLWDILKSIFRNLIDTFNYLMEILKYMFQDFDVIGLFSLMADSVKSIVTGVLELIEGLTSLIAKLFGVSVQGKEVWRAFGRGIENTLRLMARLVKLTGSLFSALGKAAKGDFKGAFMQVLGAFGDFGKGVYDDVTRGTVGDASDDARSERAQYIMKRLINAGYSPAQAAAIVGNLIQESNLRTEALSDDGQGSVGIAQWTNPDNGPIGRKTNLMNFAAAKGKSMYDLDTQIDFLIYELDTTEKAAKEALLNDKANVSGNVSELAITFGRKFERPQEEYANWENRANKAETALDEYNKSSSKTGGYDISKSAQEEKIITKNPNGTLDIKPLDYDFQKHEDNSQYFGGSRPGFLDKRSFAGFVSAGDAVPPSVNNRSSSSINIGQITVTAPNGVAPMTAKELAGEIQKTISNVQINIGKSLDIRNTSGVIV